MTVLSDAIRIMNGFLYRRNPTNVELVNVQEGRSGNSVAENGRGDEATLDSLTQLLRSDIEHYDNMVRASLAHIDRLLLSAFSVAGIAAPLLLTARQYGVLLAVPAVAFVVLFMGLNTMEDMFALAAHKFFLEEILHDLLSHHLPKELRRSATIPWDMAGGYLRRRSPSYLVLQGMYVGGLFIGSFASLAIAWIMVPQLRWLAVIVLILVLILTIVAALCWKAALAIYEKTLAKLEAEAMTSDPA